MRFDTPYGKEFRRFLSFGIGVHHAGLLPKYRLLVEQLAQQGAAQGDLRHRHAGRRRQHPDPHRALHPARQVRRREGRRCSRCATSSRSPAAPAARASTTSGSVVAQAPEHVIEKRLAERKAASGGKKSKSPAKTAAKGEVTWAAETFEKLISRPPETLKSRFKITHGMVLSLLQRDAELDDPDRRNFDSLRELIAPSHEDDGTKRRLLTYAAVLVRSLYRAGILRLQRDLVSDYRWVVIDEELQWDFSLHQALSLFLVEALERLNVESEDYPLDLLTLVESILENPDAVLRRQVDKIKGELVASLKADGVQYEERMERLEEVTHPKPLADFLYGTFNHFKGQHPWVGGRDIAPKSIGREMVEGYMSFADYVKHYGLQRSEGVLLRYLSQLYKTLDQTVPEPSKTEPVWDVLGYFRTLLQHTDTSLLEEWEELLHPEIRLAREREREVLESLWVKELLRDPKVFAARIRAELHLLVRALATKDWEEATTAVRQDREDRWDEERFEKAMAPFFEEHGELVFTPEARRHQWTHVRETGEKTWEVAQTLLDPQGDNLWAVIGTIDLRDPEVIEGPLVRIERIGV